MASFSVGFTARVLRQSLPLTRTVPCKGNNCRAISELCKGHGGGKWASQAHPRRGAELSPLGPVRPRWLSTGTPGGESVESGGGPLTGLRVVDLTRALAGPFCTMLLGDLGAEIIKIEKPGEGDDTRMWGPPFVNSESVYFMSINRNKKSVTLNLKSERGQEIIKQLVSKSDILVENYIPGKLGRFGLGYEHMVAVNPSLIYCSISGFGSKGPYAQRGGYDVIAGAYAGLVHVTGPKGGDPARAGVAMTDLTTGLYAYGAIMAALLHRAKTGRGQRVECNLLASQVALMSHLAANYLTTGLMTERQGTAHHSIVPYQAFKTSDGWLVVCAANNKQFRSLCEMMGLAELCEDERFANNEDRSTNRDALIAALSERFVQFPTSHWLTEMEGCKFPYGPINNMEQVFSDPQVQHLGLVQSVQHPTAGKVKFPGPAVIYSGFHQSVKLPPPTLGEHTQEVLQELLQYSPQDMQELVDLRVCS